MEAIAGNNSSRIDFSFNPPCKTTYIKIPKIRIIESLLHRFHFMLLPYYYRRILRISKKVKPSIIFGNYPNEVMFVAAYLVSKKLKLPFYAYMHDLWEENMKYAGRKKFASRWEKEILTNAKRLICCTQSQQFFYEK